MSARNLDFWVALNLRSFLKNGFWLPLYFWVKTKIERKLTQILWRIFLGTIIIERKLERKAVKHLPRSKFFRFVFRWVIIGAGRAAKQWRSLIQIIFLQFLFCFLTPFDFPEKSFQVVQVLNKIGKCEKILIIFVAKTYCIFGDKNIFCLTSEFDYDFD